MAALAPSTSTSKSYDLRRTLLAEDLRRVMREAYPTVATLVRERYRQPTPTPRLERRA